MRVTSQPLSFVLWDSAGVLGAEPDRWQIDQCKALGRSGSQQLALGGPALPDLGIETAMDMPADTEGFKALADELGGAPGAIFFVGADTALVTAAAAAGLRSFRYTRLARDVLGRRLRG